MPLQLQVVYTAHKRLIKYQNKISLKGTIRKWVVLEIPTMLRISDRLENGHKYVELAKEIGFGKTTISPLNREFRATLMDATLKPCFDERLDKALSPGLLRRDPEGLHYLVQFSKRRPFCSISS